jgi:phage terminase large subunit
MRIGCFREIQHSLEESSYALLVDTIARLHYPSWRVTKEYINNTNSGSHIIFRGLKDIRAAGQVKGLEGFDLFWIDEGSMISHDSLRMLLPTLRRPSSELWITYNRETELDPVDERLWNTSREDVLRVELEPGDKDNEWFPDELRREMAADYDRDPDEAEHTWGGQPRKQGVNAVMRRDMIRAAMNRSIDGIGQEQIGCDVARFGDDHTVIYRRVGLKTVEKREFVGQDTQRTAKECWDMARRDPTILIVVDDTGVGGGVTDRLREFGGKVIGFNAGGAPCDPMKYVNAITGLWFEFPVDIADIPNDSELMRQLSGRQYDYERGTSRKIIETKKKYKERLGRSPDDADALLLCYMDRKGFILPQEHRNAMRARHNYN